MASTEYSSRLPELSLRISAQSARKMACVESPCSLERNQPPVAAMAGQQPVAATQVGFFHLPHSNPRRRSELTTGRNDYEKTGNVKKLDSVGRNVGHHPD
jgi:hypothetical protein